MSSRLVLTEQLRGELVAALADEREVAAVLSVSVIDDDQGLTLLGRTLSWAAEDDYFDRTDDGLLLQSSGWVPAVRGAARAGEGVVFVHTHPGGRPLFSPHDDQVDEELRATTSGLGAVGPYAALVVAGTPDAPAFAARYYGKVGQPHDIAAIRVVGDRVQLIMPEQEDAASPDATDKVFDRQLRLLGAGGQRILSTLQVAIVGTGGTGSAVAEQLARLGVGSLLLIDDDVVTPPTPTRGYGMRARDKGERKTVVLARHLRDIGLGSRVVDVAASLHKPQALAALRHADAVFCCVDGHGGRLILNRWAWAHVAPVIDVAVLVTGGAEVAIDGRVTWLGPGSACLLCRGRIDPALAYAENLDPEARRALAGEGYVAAADTAQPAVVTLTTLVASLATTELLLRLFGFGDAAASELLVRPVQHEIRRNAMPARPGCFCTDPGFLARGLTAPYLDLMWST